jgi:surface carbohydrate biosynthesis protein
MPVANPVLYLPVESQNRELDSKLLIGAAAAAAGLKVVIGWQRMIVANLGKLPPGLILFKGLNAIQRRHMERADKAGHLILAIDEECFSIADPECMLKDIDPKAAEHCEMIFAPNSVYADTVVKHRGFGVDRIRVTGNPRRDLARAPFARMLRREADELAARFGPLILINTNTCAVNSIWGDLDTYFRVCASIGWLDPSNPEGRRVFYDHVEHDQASFEAMRQVLELLPSRFPAHNFVIRPHPSEKFEPWQEKYAHKDRFHVVSQGNNLAWIMAADLLFHTSCTTGTEAALMNKPVISIVPKGAKVAHWYISNRVNPTARSAEEAVDMARGYLTGDESVVEKGRVDRDRDLGVLLSLDQGGMAHERIAAGIVEMCEGSIDLDFQWRMSDLNSPDDSIAEANKNTFDLQTIGERLELLAEIAGGLDSVKAWRIHDELFMLTG